MSAPARTMVSQERVQQATHRRVWTSWITRWLNPHSSVEASGLALFTLWPPSTSPRQGLSDLPRIGGVAVGLGLWRAIQLVWQPPKVNADPKWVTAAEVVPALIALTAYSQQIPATAQVQDGGASTDEAGTLAFLADTQGPPAYRIYHIEHVRATVPRRVLLRIWRRQRRARSRQTTPSDPATAAIEATLGQWRTNVGISDADPRTGWAPGLFSHYDRSVNRRGWMFLGPYRALLANVSAQEVDTLATLVQPADVDITTGGIRAERYEAVLARVAQWNGTQDVFEAVGQLEALVEDGRRSTDAQSALNFALAAIGILLTLYAGPTLGDGQVVPLVLLASASVLFAIYARTGRFGVQVLGWLAFVAAVVAGGAVLAGMHLPFLPTMLPSPTPLPTATPMASTTPALP